MSETTLAASNAANNYTLKNNEDGSFAIKKGTTGMLSIDASGNLKFTLGSYASDAAAATGGVPIGGLYQTSGTVKVRLT
jgi:hypothetical protein